MWALGLGEGLGGRLGGGCRIKFRHQKQDETSHTAAVERFSPSRCSELLEAHACCHPSNHARIMTDTRPVKVPTMRRLAEVRTKMVLVHLNGINTPAGEPTCLGLHLLMGF